MTYNSVAAIQRDNDLRMRLSACAALEGLGDGNPWGWVDARMWTYAAMPEWGEAYAYAMNDASRPDDGPTIGSDEGVITDPMILSATQTIVADEKAKAEATEVARAAAGTMGFEEGI